MNKANYGSSEMEGKRDAPYCLAFIGTSIRPPRFTSSFIEIGILAWCFLIYSKMRRGEVGRVLFFFHS